MYLKKIFSVFLTLLLLTSCAAKIKKGGVYHRVQPGETLWRIAKTYDVDTEELAEINNLPNSHTLEAESVIYIPDAEELLAVEQRPLPQNVPKKNPEKSFEPKSPEKASPEEKHEKKPAPPVTAKKNVKKEQKKTNTVLQRTSKYKFMWPVQGKVFSGFGLQKNGMRNNGIKIDVKEGTPVIAAESGVVNRSWSIKFYGETIIINHGKGYMTIYAHMKKRLVETGDTIKKGQLIGYSGIYERIGRPCLHFEIRYRNQAKNPFQYLPKQS